MGPDVIIVPGKLAARAGMDHKHGVHIAVQVVVILGEVHQAVHRYDHILHQPLGVIGIGSESILRIHIVGIALWRPRPADLARRVHRQHIQAAVAHLPEIVIHGTGPTKNQGIEKGSLHLLNIVGKIYEDEEGIVGAGGRLGWTQGTVRGSRRQALLQGEGRGGPGRIDPP